MWRLVVIMSVAMLWAYYELSGGADFKPASELTAEERAAIGLRAPSDETIALLEARAEADEVRRATESAAADSVPQDSAVTEVSAVQDTAAAEPLPELPDAPYLVSAPAISAAGVATAEAFIRAEPPARAEDIRVVSGSRVNMRSGPGTNYGVITVLVQGAETEVLEELDNGWVRLRVVATGEEGYMAGRLLSAI